MSARTRRRLAVVQHTAAENLGHLEDHFENRRIGFEYFRPFVAGGRLPTTSRAGDGLVLLGGGAWGAAGPFDLPTLVEEVELTYACLTRDVPILAMGLGAQILALTAGGRSRAAPLEIRVADVLRRDDDALAGYLPPRWPLAICGRDEYQLPDSARVLASDDSGRPLVFQVGARAFGFAGNIGFKRAMAEELLMELDEAPADAPLALAKLAQTSDAMQTALVSLVTGLVLALGLM